MTAAEQVAILDRQLEESTRDFDGIIYDEEQRQREAARDRSAQTAANGRRFPTRLRAKNLTLVAGWRAAAVALSVAVSVDAVARRLSMAPSTPRHRYSQRQ